jgi:glycosyltransferase involved in cell wall biosynthesis
MVAYVGTLSTVAHGVDLLLDAFAQVLSRLPEARLLLVGDGDDREALQRQAQMLGIASRTTWVGRVRPEVARHYLMTATCSVDPVYDTPAMRGRSPLKIVESLAAGVPVVTGDVGDRREMLGDGAAGVIVPPGSAEALATGLLAVLTDPGRRSDLAAGARAESERYRWPALAEQWRRLYR